MNIWRKVPFGDILLESRDGEWGEGENKGGYQLCNMIRGTDFSSLYSATMELPQRWVKDHLVERKKLLPMDIIFEMAGGTAKQSTGRSALRGPCRGKIRHSVRYFCFQRAVFETDGVAYKHFHAGKA